MTRRSYTVHAGDAVYTRPDGSSYVVRRDYDGTFWSASTGEPRSTWCTVLAVAGLAVGGTVVALAGAGVIATLAALALATVVGGALAGAAITVAVLACCVLVGYVNRCAEEPHLILLPALLALLGWLLYTASTGVP